MLKALELVGFKSFADRTRFEFLTGITCIVGPNGSGKSNVVDAIKWVLGEQSVKSLRGKEMADCIFNGSATRTPMNAAEATLVFDNASKRLPVDAPEVAITRRVYRNGEGEYLINKQPCRLRDLRELFFNTGAATEAYSVIEQGKVDILLQSSPKERRSVFEEAAGISRFKARKIESLRRLERVDQNLLRLHDIVEEVENRLKSVRNQANKARRYREYVERLQQLRTQSASADWRRLSAQLTKQESTLAEQVAERDALAREIDSGEAKLLEVDVKLGDAVETLRRAEAGAAQLRQQIATSESHMRHERDHCRELEEEVTTRRKHLTALTGREGDRQSQVAAVAATLTAVESRHAELLSARETTEAERRNAEQATVRLSAEQETESRRGREHMQAAASAENELAVVASRTVDLEQQQVRRAAQRATLEERSAQLDREAAELAQARSVAESRRNEAVAACERARAQLAEVRSEADAAQRRVHELNRRQAALAERSQLLGDLTRRQEGLHAGVKQVLALRDTPEAGPFAAVLGMAADVIRSPFDVAGAVDAVLGDRAQYLVVRSETDLEQLAEHAAAQLAGRVGFLLAGDIGESASDGASPAGRPGVVGRLDLLVDHDFEQRPLVRRLLGRAWLVDSLALARRLREEFPRFDFATRSGEVLTSSGELLIGRRASGAGLVSRRAELQALADDQAAIDVDITAAVDAGEVLNRRIADEEAALRTLEIAERAEAERLAEERSRERALEVHRAGLAVQIKSLTADEVEATREAADIARRREEVSKQADAARQASAACEARRQTLQTEQAAAAAQLRTIEERWTALRVETAQSDERLSHLRAQKIRQDRDDDERRRAVDDTRRELAEHRRRIANAEIEVLRAEQEAALATVRLQTTVVEVAAGLRGQDQLRGARHELTGGLQRQRNRLRELMEQLHQLELSVETTRIERTNLADRIRDDYGIELSALEAQATPEEAQQHDETDNQIAELRRKINNIGNVNLDALDELDELESRFNALTAQFNDLTSAKNALEGIIAKIDADSRRLFQETLDIVRGHFQILFRKLFGGGQGDIVLEPGVDILEAGIEIMARPPGKETRNISLLSGGEKTLTCVALLLAVFQYRPSPFCVLDEVDAALDEANIGRFVGVLHEFLAWTQFIIVTHSKKTMTCATTLYGVTMQESGVSKRVAVRFEDVRDDGEIVTPKNAEESPRADRPGAADTDAA